MSIRTAKVALRGTFVALVGFSFAVLSCEVSAQVENASPTRMATFENAGQTSFALSIGPERQQSQRASDVIVFVDTSASQTGLFKKDSIEVLRGFVRNLSGDDRVRIFAVDLESVALHSDFAHPLDEKVQLAIENLDNRVSLGSTDMESMIETAIGGFDSDDSRNRNVVYIGDGMSRAGILHTKAFAKVVEKLSAARIPISSFAIGPQRNIALLAALANHTGGNIVIDNDDTDSTSQGAIALAKTIHGSVFWPVDGKLPENVAEFFPTKWPPLRTDRDSIVVGSVTNRDALSIELKGSMDGEMVSKAWSISPESSSEKFAFLPKMLTEARKDKGVSLPTVGSAGLAEYARVVDENAIDLELLSDNNTPATSGTAVIASAAKQSDSRVALPARFRQQDDPFGSATGDDPFGDSPFGGSSTKEAAPSGQVDDPFGGSSTKEAAPGGQAEDPFGGSGSKEIVPGSDTRESVPSEDPVTLPEATQADPFGEGEPGGLGPIDDSAMEAAPNQQQDPVIVEPIEVSPILGAVAPVEIGPSGIQLGTQPQSDISRLLFQTEREYLEESIIDIEDRDRIINEKLRKQVQYETERSLKELSTDPSSAIDRIKNMLAIVDETPQLTQATRTELRHKLESSLMSATRRKLDFDERQQISSRNRSTVDAIRNDILNYERREEKVVRLVGQFNSLMREGNYSVAEEVADAIYESYPDDEDANSISERARLARTHFELVELRREKERLFSHSIREIYKSSFPIPGNPPLIFPDAEEWIAKKAARAKYQNVRLAGGEGERKIIEQLENPYDLVYDAELFGDVKETLARELGINIVIDANLEGLLDDDTEVTANLVGIPLGKGLRTMLKSVDATYVVKDEVLLIISIDDELEPDFLVTDVYNVGDLVAPRSNPTAGLGGLGGQGGGFGGGRRGGNQGGGGFGGGGGGFGGGQFCVQDVPAGIFIGGGETPKAKPQVKPGTVSLKPGNLIEIDPGQDANAAWDTYFKNNQPSSKEIRATVRRMVTQERHEEIVALINSAIRNNQSDNAWMYQALSLSMQILGRPKAEIERAVMSAVDLSDSLQDSMVAAVYMSKNGMVDRSLQIFEGVAGSNPSLVQPLEAGLSIAENHNHLDGMRWSSVGVLSQEWPDKPELAKRARYAAAAVKSVLQTTEKSEELAEFEAELEEAKHRDCFIEVSWTGDADVDILVEEPGGTICSRLTPRTTAGGVYYGDIYSGGETESGKMTERYILPKGFSGDYRLIIRRMMGEVTSGKVNVAIHSHYNSSREVSVEKAVRLDSQGAIVLFELDGGRRLDDLDQHTLETLVRKKIATKQSALAQHMASFVTRNPAVFAQTGIAGDDTFQGGNGGGIGNNENFAPFIPRVVGYTPEITQIPTGTALTVNHATTADRLFVLVSTTPLISTITEVTTFNILGDADNAQGAAGGVGGAAAGGGVFGGGLGGGGFGNF